MCSLITTTAKSGLQPHRSRGPVSAQPGVLLRGITRGVLLFVVLSLLVREASATNEAADIEVSGAVNHPEVNGYYTKRDPSVVPMYYRQHSNGAALVFWADMCHTPWYPKHDAHPTPATPFIFRHEGVDGQWWMMNDTGLLYFHSATPGSDLPPSSGWVCREPYDRTNSLTVRDLRLRSYERALRKVLATNTQYQLPRIDTEGWLCDGVNDPDPDDEKIQYTDPQARPAWLTEEEDKEVEKMFRAALQKP